MKVGIAGAGSIAFGVAALLAENKHEATLWSPSGERTKELANGGGLRAKGALEGMYHPKIAATAEDLARSCDVILLALPGYGHKAAFDALVPHLATGQSVIISSHASFGALYLARELAKRGVTLPIICWGTTIVTGRQQSGGSVQVNTIRAQVDMSALPESAAEEGLALCTSLFGARFKRRDGLLAIALSNLNPQNHMGIALGNITRMERGETWSQGQHVTPKVGALLEALDLERLAIAQAVGVSVRTIFEHFHLSFHVPVASISEMNQQMHAQGSGGIGPATADSRYITEDVPYGLFATVVLGNLTGQTAKLHLAGVEIFSAMYGRDFAAENELLNALALERLSLADLKRACRFGLEN